MRDKIRILISSIVLLFISKSSSQNCPEDDPDLVVWSPGIQPSLNAVINNQKFLLVGDAMVATLTIQNNGVLVIQDRGEGGSMAKLGSMQILIQTGGELHIGSETCPYLGELDILLWGRSTDPGSDPQFGKKFIGVNANSTLEIHGRWKQSWTFLTTTLTAGAGPDPIIELADNVSTWGVGDRIVIASTDFNMYQAEEFNVLDCPSCTSHQIRIEGSPQWTHYSDNSTGVEIRAEIGLLTRNVKIRGEVQAFCYEPNWCQYYDYDTYGGHITIRNDFRSVHIEGAELYNMGQQVGPWTPIHFHLLGDVDALGGYTNPTYARQLSIHNTFNRCINIHGTMGLLVEDVVGYNSLGHCFFLFDGNEQRNVLRHNLGLITKASVILPSERNGQMCEEILTNVNPGYVPDAESECMGVSTFWITHPNNHLINNSAAGSERNGIHYVFFRTPTGAGAGTLPPYHGERSPLGNFTLNRAHSNAKNGLLVDRGVKNFAANVTYPQEIHSLQDYARYMPSVDGTPAMGPLLAIFEQLTAFKNNLNGAFIRGGEIRINMSRFADNGAGVTFASSPMMPYQEGTHQEVTESIFVGESDNRGNNDGGSNTYWLQGYDGMMRTMPQNDPSFAFHGVRLQDGPVRVADCHFARYVSTVERNVSAVGFTAQYPGQISPLNRLEALTFALATPAFFGSAGGNYNGDGDWTEIYYDETGLTSGVAASYSVRADNWLMHTDACMRREAINAAVCAGEHDYGQVYINANTKVLDLTVVRNDQPNGPVTFRGVDRDDIMTSPTSTQYQPVLLTNTSTPNSYSFHWSGVAPNDLLLTMLNFQVGGVIEAQFCFPIGTTFNIAYQEYDQASDTITRTVPVALATSAAEVIADPNGWLYYWDNAQRFLHLKLHSRYMNTGDYQYCPDEGCQRFQIDATIVNNDPSDCR